ncbi:MAG: hypothetical protein ACKV2V_00960, partial [Blastocatellia bacterium]
MDGQMDYSAVVQALDAASLFDLYRLSRAIRQILEDPKRIAQVRAQLRPGMRVTWFDDKVNHLVEATVIELKRSSVLVENLQDKQQWSLRYPLVNLAGVKTDLRPPETGKRG